VLKPVSISRDLGAVVELASGLTPNDRVIENPPDGIDTGAEVGVAGAASRVANVGKAKSRNEKG
jgi:hypothetical protein